MSERFSPSTPAVDATWTPSAERAANRNGDGRDPATGQFLPGNTAALIHGGRSERLQRRMEEEAAEALAERRLEIVEDLGGAGDLSLVASDVVDRYCTATALLGWMERRLLAEGCLTGKGRRKALHGAYLQQLDRVTRLAALLGLDREPREVKG
ncbi:MAG: hypothetical protein ACRD2Z_13145 [Thermoanaerobaculia bacterium]